MVVIAALLRCCPFMARCAFCTTAVVFDGCGSGDGDDGHDTAKEASESEKYDLEELLLIDFNKIRSKIFKNRSFY